MDFMRQADIVNGKEIAKYKLTVIGAGAVGSMAILVATKIGITKVEVFDEDGVTSHNIPNQFYREKKDIGKFKVDALGEVIDEFCGVSITKNKKFFTKEKLGDIVLVATDSMSSRKLVWNQFKKQKQCKYYIEARMGAEQGNVYTITSKSKEDIAFYEATLHDDKDAFQERCTAKSIMYNVMMINALIGKAIKSIVCKEKMPRECIFFMQNINKASFMVRQ